MILRTYCSWPGDIPDSLATSCAGRARYGTGCPPPWLYVLMQSHDLWGTTIKQLEKLLKRKSFQENIIRLIINNQ
jgi:hypothetical protein